MFNSSLSTVNSGVRGCDFALASAARVFGPEVPAVATLGAVSLLSLRRLASPTARDIRATRAELDADDEAGAEARAPPASAQASTPTPIGQVTPVPPMPQ